MRIAAALLVAAFASVALGIALAFGYGGMSAWPAALALSGGLVAGGFAWRGMTPDPHSGARIHPAEWMVIGIFAWASLRAFLWLLYVEDYEYHILSPNNLGDLPLHMDFIRYLASGVKFWPDSPIFTGEVLKYPIGGDFVNSLLLAAGLPLEQGLVWVGLAGSALTAVALWRWGRGFAMAVFIFGGGLTGFALLADPSLHNPALLGFGPQTGYEMTHAWRDLLTTLCNPPDYQAGQTWKNPFLALLVTQRGLLFAIPAGLFLLDHWRARYLRGERGLLPTWAALLLYATMPLFNVHAFLYLSVALAGMFAFAPHAAVRWQAVRFTAMAFLPATLCAALVTGGFSAAGVHLESGWMQHSEKDVGAVWFWLRNFGLYLVLGIALTIVVIVKGTREMRAIVLPACVMFLACCFVSFAPWPWDNTKILLWCWIAIAPCMWSELLRPLPCVVRGAVCIVLFFTGALSLIAGQDGRYNYELTDLTLLRQTESAVHGIPPDARFASASNYAHPLIILGRKIAMGYAGHLVSHGITYKGRNQGKVFDMENLMMGGHGWEKDAQKLGIDYLYWGPLEEDEYPGSLKPWESVLPVVAKGETFTIYAFPKR